VLITIVGGYETPFDMLTVEWRHAAGARQDPDLVLIEDRDGVPIYAHQRIAAYARWHPLRVTTWDLAWWHVLVIDQADETWKRVTRWERAHPVAPTPLPVQHALS